jgi:hypothetical protein
MLILSGSRVPFPNVPGSVYVSEFDVDYCLADLTRLEQVRICSTGLDEKGE